MTLDKACEIFDREAKNLTVQEELESRYGQVWDTEAMKRDFEPIRFQAPFIEVKRRADGQLGRLTFQHMPRFYFNFQAYAS